MKSFTIILIAIALMSPVQSFGDSGPASLTNRITDESTRVAVFLDGAVVGASEKGGASGATTGALRFFVQKKSGNYNASISVAAEESVKNREEGFGGSILAMTGSNTMLLEGYHFPWKSNELLGIFDGLHWSGMISAGDWMIPSEVDGGAATPEKMVMGGLELRGLNEIVNIPSQDQLYLLWELGITTRFLGGDIQEEERDRVLGVEDSSGAYFGGLTGLTIGFNSIKASADLYYMFGGGDNHIDGLNGFQAVFKMEISANALTRTAKEKNPE